MRQGIRLQFTWAFLLFFLFFVAATVAVNTNYLEKYYLYYKEAQMGKAAKLFADYEAEPTDENLKAIFSFSESRNTNFAIIKDGALVTASGWDEDLLKSRIQMIEESEEYADSLSEKYSKAIYYQGALSAETGGTVVLVEKENYTIYQVYDSSASGYYLECFGILEDGSDFIMRTPFQGMKEAIIVSNNFHIFTGIAAVFLGVLAAYLIAGQLTKPIRRLTEVATRMETLDFTARYEGRDTNEIGVLGSSFNSMSEKLEKTVSELKTANLQLQNDLEERRKIDESRTEFISDVTHDLKTPISIIQGYAEGLKEGVAGTPEDMAYYCDVIIDEAQQMDRMVKKLLLLNQIESGGEKPEITHFDLTGLISEMASTYQVPMAEHKISLDLPATPCYIWADHNMIRTAVGNCLGNAFHFVNENGIIRLYYETVSLDTARLCIFNSGSHVQDEDMEKIWRKFYREDKARKRSGEGNGIGLAIVKAIMEKHGRSYGAVNQKDGVMFYMEFDTENPARSKKEPE